MGLGEPGSSYSRPADCRDLEAGTSFPPGKVLPGGYSSGQGTRLSERCANGHHFERIGSASSVDLTHPLPDSEFVPVATGIRTVPAPCVGARADITKERR